MLEAGGAALAGVLLFVIAIRRYRYRNPEWRYRHLAKKTSCLPEMVDFPSSKDASSLLVPIYSLIYEAFETRDEKRACQGIVLLKNCVSAGWLRVNEAEELKWLAFAGFRYRQADSVSQIVDILCILPTRQIKIDLPEVARQLTAVGLHALKEKENFIAAKAADGIIALLTFRKIVASEKLVQLCLQGIKAIGAAALHRHDIGLFREIAVQLADWADKKSDPEISQKLIDILTVWLHDIVKNEDEQGLEVMTEFLFRIIESKEFCDDEISLFLQEWLRLAGIAALNPESTLAPSMMFAGLQAAAKQEDLLLWTLALSAAGQISAQGIQQRGIAKAFSVLYPILETGRILLGNELKFGGDGYADSYRQQALQVVVNESLILINLAARRSLISTVDEMIAEARGSWLNYPSAYYTRKQAKKYCQLLYFYWRQTQGKSGYGGKETETELIVPLRLTEQERKRIKFLA
ncbi:MAG: hypothetical protein AB9895_01870 [Negativicutes bacterium]